MTTGIDYKSRTTWEPEEGISYYIYIVSEPVIVNPNETVNSNETNQRTYSESPPEDNNEGLSLLRPIFFTNITFKFELLKEKKK